MKALHFTAGHAALWLGLALTPVAASLAASEKTDAKETELGNRMEDLNGAYRKLRRQVGDPTKNDDSLKQVGAIRKKTEESLTLTPAKAEELPAGEREKFVADYRRALKAFDDEVA